MAYFHATLLLGSLAVLAYVSFTDPQVDVTVQLRDEKGAALNGLSAKDFTIDEQGRFVSGETLAVEPIATGPTTSIAIVVDLSSVLRQPVLAAMQNDFKQLAELALRPDERTTTLALFVPRDPATEQPLVATPFTNDRATLLRQFDATPPRTGVTDLYNAAMAAVSAVGEEAQQRGGTAQVIVLSDGFDRTSIVGSGTKGANEVAQLAAIAM